MRSLHGDSATGEVRSAKDGELSGQSCGFRSLRWGQPNRRKWMSVFELWGAPQTWLSSITMQLALRISTLASRWSQLHGWNTVLSICGWESGGEEGWPHALFCAVYTGDLSSESFGIRRCSGSNPAYWGRPGSQSYMWIFDLGDRAPLTPALFKGRWYTPKKAQVHRVWSGTDQPCV